MIVIVLSLVAAERAASGVRLHDREVCDRCRYLNEVIGPSGPSERDEGKSEKGCIVALLNFLQLSLAPAKP